MLTAGMDAVEPTLGSTVLETVVVFQAHKVYEDGASLGLFRSVWQRSLYNVDRLQSWPWWTVEQTGGAAEHFKVCSFSRHLHCRLRHTRISITPVTN